MVPMRLSIWRGPANERFAPNWKLLYNRAIKAEGQEKAALYERFSLVYDALMRGVDYDGWANYLDRLLRGFGAPEGASVLECACGTGEITLRLARLGYRVIASDVSADMLRVAQEKAREKGIAVPFVEQDMRSLSAHRPADAVLAACDGVNYLLSTADLAAFFSAAARALKPGGLLLFDVSSAHKLKNVLGCNTFGEDDGTYAYLWRNAFDPEARLLEMRLSFFVREGSAYARFTETHVQRAHTRREIASALKRCGFTLLAAYEAFFERAPRQNAERIQFVARRTEPTDGR